MRASSSDERGKKENVIRFLLNNLNNSRRHDLVTLHHRWTMLGPGTIIPERDTVLFHEQYLLNMKFEFTNAI
jgi:hypothetical protein